MKSFNLFNLYKASLIVSGLFCFLFSLYSLPLEILGWGFLFLLFFAVIISPKLSLTLPNSKFTITFSDSLIFLTLLFYGGQAAIILASLEMLTNCLYTKKIRGSMSYQTILGNISTISLSTAATYLLWIHNPIINSIQIKNADTRNLAILLGMLAFYNFLTNSILVATFQSLKFQTSLWATWKKNCFSSALFYVVGAVIAGILFQLIYYEDFLLTTIALLSVIIVYVTFKLSIEEVVTANAQTELAEREKAEIEKERRLEAEKLNEQLKFSLEKEENANTALRQSQKALEHSAYYDSLTNLANRKQFVEVLRQLIFQYREDSSKCFHVLFLDINRFKNINDSFGHTVGDRVLTLIARRFLRNFRANDTVARLGGDEFAIILHDLQSVNKALKVARKIHQAVAQPFALSGNRIFVSLNIGVAPCDTDYETPEEILRDADIAMHYAREKKMGVAVFSKELRERFLERVKLEHDLRFAAERGELLMNYQPLVSLDSGSIIGFEALIRWQHPELGLIPPVKFIPIAEDSGLIIPITIWILDEVCSKLAAWQKISPTYRDLIMSVNISGKHLSNDELYDEIEEVLDTYNLAPETLKLEITESVAMENAEQTIGILTKLKQIGVQLSIDDFGTGYSSLNYLHRLPFDTLKIDRSFVYSVGENGENSEILETIISLAKNLKMKVIAEGIETENQLSMLRTLGCDYGQGYLLSRPKSTADTQNLLEQNANWLPVEIQNSHSASSNDSMIGQSHIF